MTDAQIYCISAFVTGLTAYLLAAFVSLKASRRRVAAHFGWYMLAIGTWSIFVGFATWTKSESVCYLTSLICHAAALFIPVTLLDFVRVYTGNRSRLIERAILGGYTLMGALALQIIVYPQLFIPSVSNKLGFYYFPDAGPTYHFWVVFFTVTVLVANSLLLVEGMRLRGAERKKTLAFFAANLIGYAGGAGAFLPVYSLGIFPFPYGIWGVFFFTLITAYAVLRLQLIDLESELKKTIVFAGIFSFVFAVFAATTILMRDFLSAHLQAGRIVSMLITVFIITLLYDHIRTWMTRLTDRYLFQKKFDYQKILKDASRGLSQIENLKHLLGLVIHFMTMRARITRAAVYIRNTRDEDFILQLERGFDQVRLKRRIPAEGYLVKFFGDEREALDVDRLELLIENHTKHSKWDILFLRRLVTEMETMEAKVCIPTFLGGTLKHFLLLGEKKSGDRYTDDDLNLLYTLAQESAIAIENARLYDEAVKKNLELRQINHQLGEASRQLQTALAVTEQANKKLQDTQALLIHEQKMATLGRLASSVGHEVNNPLAVLQMNVNRLVLKLRKDPTIPIADIAEFFPKMEANINRIKAVVNTLTGLLKKHEKGKMEPLSLKLLIEETLPLVQFQTYLDNLSGTDIVFNIPGNIPLIKGDLERLQEVFLNIFINAFHALADRESRRIEIIGVVDPDNPRLIRIEFKDNGCGMSEETLKQIFNYRFTTKPDGKGSGLGLYIAKYIVELHGGTITADSHPGEGSVFTVRLPIYEPEEARQVAPLA